MIWPLHTGTGLHSYPSTSIPAVTFFVFSFLQLSTESYKQGIPQSLTKKLRLGLDFTYVCCAERNKTIWFRWGLYLHGSHRDPVPLYSRATVKGLSYVDNMWSRDFNGSMYKNRGKVTFNPKTLCMAWTISRVRKGDDNTFFGAYRDDPGRGKQFKPCNTTVRLIVLDAKRPFSTASTPTPSYLDLDTPPTGEGSHVTKHLDLDTPPTSEGSHVTKKPTTDEDTEDTSDPLEIATEEPKTISDSTIAIVVIASVILIAGIIGTIIYFKFNQIRKWFDSARGRFKDRAINAQEMTRISIKRLKRRRRTTVIK